MIEEYRNLCDKILEILKADEIDDKKLKLYFERRDEIIKDLANNKEQIENFKKTYQNELEEKDNEIKMLLQKNINKVKEEMLIYRKNVNANCAYKNMHRKKMNIFSTTI